MSCTVKSGLWVQLQASCKILSMQSDTSISYILSDIFLQKFMLTFLNPDHIFIGGQFENQEDSLTNGDCSGKHHGNFSV